MLPRAFRRRTFLSLALFSATVSVAASQNSPDGHRRFYINDRIGIKILLPAEWQLTSEIKGPSNQPLIVTLGRPGILVQVTLTREVLEATPEIYKNLLKRNFSRQVEDYRELGEEKVTQGGLEGSKIAFSVKANNVTNRIWLLIFSKGNQHYWISAAAPEEYFDSYESTFQEMVDSVEFLGPASKAPSATEEAVGSARTYSGTTGQITYSPAAEVARLRERVAQSPDDYQAHMELANALDDSGDTDPAIAEYKVAIALNPVFPLAHGNLGASYIRKKDWKAAETELREAVRLAPDYFMAHFRLVYVLVWLDDLQGAFNEYREIIRIDQEQARSLMFQEFPALAQQPGVQQEIASAPTDAVAHLYIALQLIRLKKPCRSWIHQLDEVLRIAPRFAFAQQLRKEGRQGCK
ncbi:MAG: tetratricopeptide repeat protein [Acidobacteria bacterium]|nr:tetratricopeptide repeat protein [Acidobacteriota bacterium]